MSISSSSEKLVINDWEHEYEDKELIKQTSSEQLAKLEAEKKETIAMRRRGELELEDYEEEMDRIKRELFSTQTSFNENEIDRGELELLLTQAEMFLKNIKPLYSGFSPKNKRRMAHMIFPNGVTYSDGVLQTSEKADIFRLFDEMESGNFDVSTMVTLRGIEPRFPG